VKEEGQETRTEKEEEKNLKRKKKGIILLHCKLKFLSGIHLGGHFSHR